MDMVDTLLESLRIAPALLDERLHYSNSLSLHLAATTGDIEIIQQLLNYGYDVNTRDNGGMTPFHRAVEKGKVTLAVVNLFLAQPDIDSNRADSCGRTPMWLATRYGRDDVASRLLALPDLNLNAAATEVTANAGEETSTSLHHVVRRGSPPIARLQVATKQLDPNVTDHLGRTPLHWAANNVDLAMVNLLLDRLDMVVASKDTKGSTPLKMAIQQGHFGVAHRLLQHPSYRPVTAFLQLSRL
jgi:ankyrin repeat protein